MGEETDVVHLKRASENEFAGTISVMRRAITPGGPIWNPNFYEGRSSMLSLVVLKKGIRYMASAAPASTTGVAPHNANQQENTRIDSIVR